MGATMTDTYRIKKSEFTSNDPDTYIDIELGGINTSATDLALVGRTREYGEEYNENILHLLENFASPEVDDTQAESVFHAIPAFLNNPIDGQSWFNTTRKISYVYFRGRWYPQAYTGDVASNWGSIASGVALPLPVGAAGQTFTYDECAWVVAPVHVAETMNAFVCEVDPVTGILTSTFDDETDTTIASEAFYQIVAIRSNDYLGGNDDSSFRVTISDYLTRTQVPPINSFPREITSTDVITVEATPPALHTLEFTWMRVSPSTADGFPAGYTIEPVVSGPTSPTALFRITVSSPGVFVATQKVVRGATFVCRVDVLDGSSTVVDTKLSLPVRVEFYNY